ncbi:major capsid protein [Ideonella sp.]|uniref:major capsid protein n=1 Tax=Ideonella sp. TaxID=1929293 RepID=UPI00351BA383
MNKFAKLALAVPASLAMLGAARADVPTGVSTALASIGVDGSTVATTILLAVVAIFAIKFLRKGL